MPPLRRACILPAMPEAEEVYHWSGDRNWPAAKNGFGQLTRRYPSPRTPRGDNTTCQSWISRARNRAAKTRQVVAPHAVEPLAICVAERRPGGIEIGPPGHQRPVVVGAEIVPVLHHEQPFDALRRSARSRAACRWGRCTSPSTGRHASVELVAPDGVQQEQPVGLEQRARLLEIGAVVLVADMLEHADRDDPVELCRSSAM